ncbi:MAG: AbrB/MazE/SpoVT family DNA-binding domain-containing protein [Thermoplasmatales archaeon]
MRKRAFQSNLPIPGTRYIWQLPYQDMIREKILDVAHVSKKGTSYRVTIPRKIAERLGLADGDILMFTDDNGIKISKLE